MSQKNGFSNGFILGSIVGGIIGGVLGTLLANKSDRQLSVDNSYHDSLEAGTEVRFNPEESIEMARNGLEDKIAQLNMAIDDVRQQLGSVSTNNSESD